MLQSSSLLVIGCGDIGLRVARLWPDQSRVTGMLRSADGAATLRAAGIYPWQHDLDSTASLQLPTHLTLAHLHVLYLAPPAQDALEDRRLQRFLAALPARPQSFVYISTSGVYGDRRGAWVDEGTPPAPLSDRAKRRVDAEQRLQIWQAATAARLTILRVPGIYGPGRLPLDKIKQGTPLIRPNEAPYTNLIQADDLARVCLAAVERGNGIYNVADGNSITSTDYYLQVAHIAGLQPPPFIGLDEAQRVFDPVRLSFINESRRLNIDRMRTELRPHLQYTDLAEGIRASLAAG
jgi:nucleoside-diphosphate-sugar epimerase